MAEVTVVRAAARNNAEWCDVFCRTHGVAARFGSDCWTSAARTPPLYSDAVTLSPRVTSATVLSEIDANAGCSVKDSFGDLDLGPDGFRPLLHGEWLLWENGDATALASRWLAIETGEQLVAWESAWGASPAGAAFFRPALLANTAVTVLARYDDDRIAAGAIANRSATVIGLSNLFDARGDLEAAWLEAARAALVVDDVVSTGSTVEGMLDVLAQVNANVVGVAAVFTEGDEPNPDVIALGHLPLFRT